MQPALAAPLADSSLPILPDGEGGPAVRPGISEKYDYELITRKVWNALVRRYGMRAGSEIPIARRVVWSRDNGAERKMQCELEMNPPRFNLYYALDDGTPSQSAGEVCVQLSRHTSTTESLVIVQRALDRALDQERSASSNAQRRILSAPRPPHSRRLWFLPPPTPETLASRRRGGGATPCWMLLHHSPSVIIGHLLEGMLYSRSDAKVNTVVSPSVNTSACTSLPSLLLEIKRTPRSPTPPASQGGVARSKSPLTAFWPRRNFTIDGEHALQSMWRNVLKCGQRCDALDSGPEKYQAKWFEARVVEERGGGKELRVHFLGWVSCFQH